MSIHVFARSKELWTACSTSMNDLRAQNGKTSLGLLNPLFYANPTAFNDITSGRQSGGEGCEEGGFTATKGWDPVTGLGTPNFEKLSAVVAALP